MKKFLVFVTTALLCHGLASSQVTLNVNITGLRNNSGKLMIQLFDEKENVLDQQIINISDLGGKITFNNLKPGNYAIRFYHDENMNRKLDTSLVGKPVEGYGFSNNVSSRFSMPPFEKWLFDLRDNKTITIRALY